MKRYSILLLVLFISFSSMSFAVRFDFSLLYGLTIGMPTETVLTILKEKKIKFTYLNKNEAKAILHGEESDELVLTTSTNLEFFNKHIGTISIKIKDQKVEELLIDINSEDNSIIERKVEKIANCLLIISNIPHYTFDNCSISFLNYNQFSSIIIIPDHKECKE